MHKMKMLLSKPDHFRIDFSINDWMDKNIQIDTESAVEEYRKLKETLRQLGYEVTKIYQDENHPDMVFTRDFGVVSDDRFLSSKMSTEERAGENQIVSNYFREAGYKVINSNHNWEGGDLMKINDKEYFLGYGNRSEIGAAEEIRSFLEEKVIPLIISNKKYYHLDTCLGIINNDTCVIIEDAFDEKELKKLRNRFKNYIVVPEEDHNNFTTNFLVVEDNILISDSVSKETRELISETGYNIIPLCMNEYQKSGGSVRCVTLEM